MTFRSLILPLAALIATLGVPRAQADTLQEVRAHGALRCGVGQAPGYAAASAEATWSGFMVDMCRAVAAAALGSADKVIIEQVEISTRFSALAGKEIDLLTAGTTWTLKRETALGFDFPVVYLYDGQGFLTPKSNGLKSITDLKDGRICVTKGSTSEVNLGAYLQKEKLALEIVALESNSGTWESMVKGRCDVLTNDRVLLSMQRLQQLGNPDDYEVLPDTISREPLGPVVRGDDRRWAEVVRWTVYATIAAEELGVTSRNIDSFAGTEDVQIQVLLGVGNDHAEALGLEPGWMRRVIAGVGNYGEIYSRNLTATLGVLRGQNALWRDGGYLYAPPLY